MERSQEEEESRQNIPPSGRYSSSPPKGAPQTVNMRPPFRKKFIITLGWEIRQGERLAKLIKRMEVEEQRVINYIDYKREIKISRGVTGGWKRKRVFQKDGKTADEQIKTGSLSRKRKTRQYLGTLAWLVAKEG
jgi:hypothetical protein